MVAKRRILVCGGREYANLEQFNRAMYLAKVWFDNYFCVIQGGARGADRMAAVWAFFGGYPMMQMPANWDFYDKKAGTIRNTWMLDFGLPDLVIAFPGGRGTANMVEQSHARNLDVWEVPHAF